MLQLPGVSAVHADLPHFHEAVFALPCPAQQVIDALAEDKFLAGVSLAHDYLDADKHLLICVTETKTIEDIEIFVTALGKLF
jgi:glycine dehydrogenase subunit 1